MTGTNRPSFGAAFVVGGAMGFSVDEIDAALARALGIPQEDRTEAWHAIVDGLLEQRLKADLVAQGRSDGPRRD